MRSVYVSGFAGLCQLASHRYAVIAYKEFTFLGMVEDKQRNIVA